MSAKEIFDQSGGKNSEESSSYVVGLLFRPLYKRPPGYCNQIYVHQIVLMDQS